MKKLIICDWNRTLYDPDQNQIYTNSIKFLELIKNNLLVLVSTNELGTEKYFEKSNLAQYFTKIILNQPKTKKLFLEIKKGFPNFEAWVVGDRLSSEIKAGNEAGYITIRIKQGKFRDEQPNENSEIPTVTVLNLNEAAEILMS